MRCLAGFCAANAEKDDAGAFVKLAQQMEEQRTARGAERQVAQLICYPAGDLQSKSAERARSRDQVLSGLRQVALLCLLPFPIRGC